MTNEKYAKTYKEIVEILKYMPKESVNKIPSKMLEMFNEEQSKDYNFKIDTEKPFEEQELLEETKAILANMFRDYWATEYQREIILQKEKFDREELEKIKREKYNPDDIFEEKEKTDILSNKAPEESNKLPVEIKKENLFKRLIIFIKKFLHLQ